MKALVGAATIGLCALAGTRALSQERAGELYASGGVTLAWQKGPSGSSPFTIYVTAPGGASVGWSASAGVFVSRWLSLEGTFATTGTMTAREPSRYNWTFDETRRDGFFAGGLRVHIPIATVFDLEPLAGFGVARTEISTQTEIGPTPYSPLRIEPVQTTTVTTPQFTFGAAARLGGGRAAVVPSFNLVRTLGSSTLDSWYPGGHPEWTVMTGVALRFSF